MTDFDHVQAATTSPETAPAGGALVVLLDSLPTKARVHELAKRIGVTSRVLIDVLAAHGVTVTSASASVDIGAARPALTALLGNDEAPVAAASEPVLQSAQDVVVEAEPAPSLFVEPVVRPARAATVKDPEFELAAVPARSRVHELAKRAGVSTKAMIAALAEHGVVAKSANSVIARAAAEAALASLLVHSESAGAEAPTGDTDDATTEAVAGPDFEANRARRRGRRGRGRPADTADGSSALTAPDSAAETDSGDSVASVATHQIEDTASDQTERDAADAADADDAADAPGEASDSVGGAPTRTSRRRRRRGGRGPERPAGAAPVTPAEPAAQQPDGPVAEGADDSEADAEYDDSPAGSSARRRRRRRRGGSEDAARVDDPADTVLHVRDARSAEAQVQGVRGSTRLEAKRQRRRESLQTRRRPQILTEAEFLARREAVHRVMAVRQRAELTQVAMLEDGVLVEHFVSRAGTASMIGNIYLGRVQNVLPSMEAAFVDIGRGRNAVLYAGEVNWDAAGLAGKSRKIETALKSGDTVLVQVSKDPIGHKGARLTTQISLPGRFLVYVPAGGATGISRKLPDTERRRLKAILDRIVPEDAGVIIRTAAEGVPEDELARDVDRLKTQWEQISAQATKLANSGAAKLLYSEPDTLIKVIRDLFNSDISELIIDGEDGPGGVWDALATYVEQVAPELAPRVTRFTGITDVFAAHRIDEQIAKALERKVYLPSGGSLVIDRTEAMTVVDVNTGKYTGSGGNLEETVTKNNLEAAEEVVRQLRLRDIGGIIVIDFIDMVLESNRDLVLRRLTECLGRDRTRHQVAEVTSLGLVQMTRKKMGTGLVEAFSEPCEHCHGRGIVLRDVPIDNGPAEIVEAPSGAPDRMAGRRRRGRDREPIADVEPIAAVQPQLPPLRRDPRGPKPPELGSLPAPAVLADELVAELSGRSLETPVDRDGSAAAPVLAEWELELLGATEEDPAAGSQPARRRRGGRGRSRGSVTAGQSELAVEPTEDVDALVGGAVTADADDADSVPADTDTDTDTDVIAAEPVTDPDLDGAPTAIEVGPELAEVEPPVTDVATPITAAPAARPARRRSARRPAGPPQAATAS